MKDKEYFTVDSSLFSLRFWYRIENNNISEIRSIHLFKEGVKKVMEYL